MADKKLLDDRSIVSVTKREKTVLPGWDIVLSCGHKFWSPTEISKNLLMVCFHCVRQYAGEEKKK